jgi:hypothetical protein
MSEKHFGLDVNNPTSYNDIVKKILITVLPIIVIAGLIIAAYEYLMSTPLAKGLSGILGGAGALLASIGHQLETCSDNGFFSGGCYLGWFVIAVPFLWIGAKAINYFTAPKIPMIENTATLRGVSSDTVKQDIIDSMKKAGGFLDKLNEQKFDIELEPALIGKGFTKLLLKQNIEAIKKSALSPAEQEAKIAEARAKYEYEKAFADQKFDLDEDSSKETDKIVDDLVPIE